ncbi:ADP-ribose glycohydrolase ARH3-like [Ischnura elegans]|uniref:ADP-ribose glycohydrolase ARH3-like n=1 Tax=Ischnura elegans TaxID=197161 RepID=UPI001ED8902E|nr:ADP-ribose glycohydrolase ARH3-like [Ischnura elegans]
MRAMALVDGLLMASKFRGCMLGVLVGDCLGFPYEDDVKPSYVVLQNFFDTLESSTVKAPRLIYTDDTAMTHCIAESLIKKKEVDARDLAKRFVKEYLNQPPDRGYGIHVREVFHKLRASKFEDPLRPAREQFGGSGSWGNGGAMRIAPIALFYRGQGTQLLGDMARKVTEVTHTHRNGINGAILQCLAIEQCLWLDPKEGVKGGTFLEELIAKMELFEGEENDNGLLGRGEEAKPFSSRLHYIRGLLQREGKAIDEKEDVLMKLGAGIAALASVPTAIFCFLRAHTTTIPNIETSNPLRRTIQYAISLGGDTDTIGSMAGALSGATLGYSDEYFSKKMLKRCDGVDEALSLADELLAKSPRTTA